MKQKKLTKKNLIAFAKSLYKKTGKKETFVPLCYGALTKANGEVMNCALGELYANFIGPTCRLATADEVEQGFADEGDLDFGLDGTPKWVYLVSEDQAANRLVENATTKTSVYDEDLLHAISEEVPKVNDSLKGMTTKSMAKRAQRVQEKLIDVAHKFLKG